MEVGFRHDLQLRVQRGISVALHGQFFKTVLKWEQGAVMTVLGTGDGRKERRKRITRFFFAERPSGNHEGSAS